MNRANVSSHIRRRRLMASNENKKKALDAAIAKLEKDYGKGTVMKLGDPAAQVAVETVPTGSLSLDIALGMGGVPKGRIVEIYGPESSGKTTVALHMRISHIAFNLLTRYQCRNRVNNNDVHSTGTHHSLCNLKCLISTVRLRDIQFINVNTYIFSVYRIKRMFCIDKSCNTASFLYL